MRSRILGSFNLILRGIGSICLFASMVLICADVFMRYFFNAPIAGTLELTELAPVIVTYCFFTQTAMLDRHIRTTFVIDRLSDRMKGYATFLSRMLMFALLTIIVWRTSVEALWSWQIREIKQGIIAIPQYPVKIFIPLALAVAWFYYLGLMIDSFKRTESTSGDRQ